MTRRITLAILLTVWAMLVAGGGAAYWTTRVLLLADLDDALVGQALARPEILSAARRPESPTALRDGDRYVIQNEGDRRKLRTNQPPETDSAPQLVAAQFSTRADGVRLRTVTVRAFARGTGAGEPPAAVLVTYTGSAEAFHRLLERLAWVLAACVVVGGIVAAGLAHRVSGVSLRPLRRTADEVGSIDERQLNRRISLDKLPPELLPMAQRLNEMLQRLEQAFAQRRQFVADASHELRTPVAALVTSLEVTLARQRDAAGYRATLEIALGDAGQLRRLVERLMEQVRSENFEHDEPRQPVNVSTMLDACADVAVRLGESRQIRVKRDYPPSLQLNTQPGRLRSVMQNVLANAVEYNRAGGEVCVTASCNGHGLELSVTDTGAGISPEQVPHLFEPFYRGDESHKADAGHLGLGLYLVNSHLRALGGRCTVQSEVGRGSTFHVQIPVAADVQPSPATL